MPARRLSTVRDANTIAVVYKGRIVEQGSHDEVGRRMHPGFAHDVASCMWQACVRLLGLALGAGVCGPACLD